MQSVADGLRTKRSRAATVLWAERLLPALAPSAGIIAAYLCAALLGLTLALPVNRNNSIKLYASGGASTRTGTEFNAIGIAWQYRWGGGF